MVLPKPIRKLIGRTITKLYTHPLLILYFKWCRGEKSFDADNICTKIKNGYKIVLPKRDRHLGWDIRFSGIWSPSETILLEKMLKKGQTVIEVGANYGFFTLLMSKIIGDQGKIVSFEANPLVFNNLKNSILLNKITNVELHNKGLSDREFNSFIVWDNKNIGAGYILDEKEAQNFDVLKTLHEKVKVSTLSKEFHHNLKVDFLTMDIEGYEFFVLKGADDIINNNHDILIKMEWCPSHLIRAGETVEHFIEYLEEKKFKVYEIDHYSGSVSPIQSQHLKSIEFGNILLSRHVLNFD